MILGREWVLTEGREFFFRSAPVDPNDPFRGKYIVLAYEANSFPVPDATAWQQDQEVFVVLDTDTAGFARIAAVYPEAPEATADYVSATVNYVDRDEKSSRLIIRYPFDRYYMEESKAGEAEQAYRESLRDTLLDTYAIVYVKDGEAVLSDVMIDDRPIREVVKARE
jgi:uncharacterized membrane-anchored protein